VSGRITADTNLLVRVLTGDDAAQAAVAGARLGEATLVALTLPSLCELVWVLRSRYRHTPAGIAQAIRRLTGAANVSVDRLAVEAGLAVLEAGGDFADGVIAHEGEWLGADIFPSFDRRAVDRLHAGGVAVEWLG
jgi:predicted nucleic-acid-binding protein